MTHPTVGPWSAYPPPPQHPHDCHWADTMGPILGAVSREFGTTLAFGRGRSYGDVCMAASDHVIRTIGMDRVRSADWSTGVLVAECGITLGQILSICIPRGWFLAVTPGTRHVTIGGAIANDVHGKNHHVRGSFGRHVQAIGLLRSDAGPLVCTPTENAALFEATIGGLGLTGLIEWARIQLVPIRSSVVDAVSQRFDDLAEFLALSTELDPAHEFSVSWVDCTRVGADLGRGIYSAGNFASTGPLAVDEPRGLRVPVTPPVTLINGLTVAGFNALYWRKQPRGRRQKRAGYGSFFYPLDGIEDWNRAYGPSGFQQYQCVVPEVHAPAALRELLATVARSKGGSFLAVIKRCGALPSPGLLSFPMAGITLALDFAQSMQPQQNLFPRLDAIVREAGGRLYPAKDAHMSGEDFRRMYPDWERVEQRRDPALMSRFWQRVTG